MIVRQHQLVDLDQVRMRHVRERAELLLEPIDRRGVGVADRLDRDAHIALEVIRLVHDPHAAGPDPPSDGEPIGAAELADSSRSHRVLDALTREASRTPVAANAPDLPWSLSLSGRAMPPAGPRTPGTPARQEPRPPGAPTIGTDS